MKLKSRRTQKPKSRVGRIIAIVIADILVIGVGLVVFALFHHVLQLDNGKDAVVLPAPEQVAVIEPIQPPASTQEPSQPEPEPTEQIDWGTWGEKFQGKFTTGDITTTDNSYISEDINVTLSEVKQDDVTYYVADIYIRDLANFKTAFGKGEYGKGNTEHTVDMAITNDAIIAVSGDYYSIRGDGIVIRNGKLYRDELYEDVLIMNNDGSMETFTADEFDIDAVFEQGAYQGWSFGPMLLRDGQAITEFDSSVADRHPRCAIGYYEPGHYCFVLVDGRRKGHSVGMTLSELSQLFYDLGCKVAYNLDGGKTAVMAYMGEVANRPYEGGRRVSDIVYIGESAGDQS